VREKASTSDAYAVAEILHSRTSPLPLSLLRDSATSKTWWCLPQNVIIQQITYCSISGVCRRCVLSVNFFDWLYAIADKPPSSFKGFVRQGAGCKSVTNSA
ncbi:hypothetical protein, partial [Pseudomonas viridiflava]|uniref:hypothetical protein n=1 Tax=Pseudomonas viridiflava TaxID=33069 RepID=UPI002EC067EF|nr:hypothetical protein [Pseudomonas viridiflava]